MTDPRPSLFLAGLLVASGLCAQQFVRATPVGHDELEHALGFADLNGDGAPDLFLNGDGNGALAIRLTDQSGRLGPRIELRDPVSSANVAFATGDIDGDGDPDIVVGVAAFERIHVYRNDGPLGFNDVSQAQMPSQPVVVSRLDLLDVDGDGDLDLHAARHGTDRLYINDGAGGFTDQTATRIPWRSALEQLFDVATGDVDGDGDVDLVIATDSGPSLRLNDGTGVFTDVAAPASATEVLAVEVADFDGDGIADLYYGTFVNPPSSPIGPAVDELWLGTGAGGFVLAPVIGGGFVTANQGTTVTDLNGDAWPDLVIGAREGTFVRFGSAAGLSPGVELLDRAGNSTSDWWPLAADLDADGDTDVVAWWRWFRNDGTGQFAEATDPRRAGAGARAAVDVDLDGDLDLVGFDTLAINDGNARFPVLHQLPAKILAMGDVDGDGDLDALGHDISDRSLLMLNDGAMNFAVDTAGRLPSLPCDGFVLGDWDQDGDLDAYMLGGISLPFVPGDDAVFENDGTGSFTDVSAQALPAAVRSVSGDVADFDGDGIVDILLSNGLLSTQAPRLRILLGQPGGGFRVSTAVPPSPFVLTASARFVDIDGDGDLDVVAASSLVLENAGGVLVDVTGSSLSSGAYLSPPVLVGDVDEDGDQDVVAGQELLINDGTGVFTPDRSRLPATSDALFLADLDRDGDLDLSLSNDLWLNHDRHIDVIRVPRVGASFGIEVHRQPGYGAGAGIALLGHADAPAAVATAIPGVGVLLLDVGTLQIPFSVAIDGSGTGMLQIQVPAQPALRGLDFWFQAGILRPGTATRLTNMERVRIE